MTVDNVIIDIIGIEYTVHGCILMNIEHIGISIEMTMHVHASDAMASHIASSMKVPKDLAT